MGPGTSDDAVRAALERCGLGEKVARTPDLLDRRLDGAYEDGTGLSGGEYRRLRLARILLQERPVWILDEPTSSLDSDWDAAFMELVRTAAPGTFIVVVTHKPLELADAD